METRREIAPAPAAERVRSVELTDYQRQCCERRFGVMAPKEASRRLPHIAGAFGVLSLVLGAGLAWDGVVGLAEPSRDIVVIAAWVQSIFLGSIIGLHGISLLLLRRWNPHSYWSMLLKGVYEPIPPRWLRWLRWLVRPAVFSLILGPAVAGRFGLAASYYCLIIAVRLINRRERTRIRKLLDVMTLEHELRGKVAQGLGAIRDHVFDQWMDHPRVDEELRKLGLRPRSRPARLQRADQGRLHEADDVTVDDIPADEIDAALRKLMHGLSLGPAEDQYEGYRTLLKLGPGALHSVEDVLLQSDWTHMDGPHKVRLFAGLFNLVHDLDEARSEEIANALMERNCHSYIESQIRVIRNFSIKDFRKYRAHGLDLFVSNELRGRDHIAARIESWLETVEESDLSGIERLFVIPSERGLSFRGRYRPMLFVITLVWKNSLSQRNPLSLLGNLGIESTLYHEIGHHSHRHGFGQIPDQEEEADDFAARMMRANHPTLYKLTAPFGLFRAI